MSVLLVRHGLSGANDRNSAAFGQADALLLPAGIEHGRMAADVLALQYGINPEEETVAASKMLRSQQTASVGGFMVVKAYLSLNEVDVPKTPELRAILNRGEIIPEAYRAAERVLSDPPAERVWFCHGYLIAALCAVTGTDTADLRFIPRFGEVREIQ